MNVIAPGARIGILGGGQLGRMLALAAARLGFDVLVYTPEADSPAARAASASIEAAYNDARALADFAMRVDVVTTEFENVPAETARLLIEAGAKVAPNPRAIELTQDRLNEKELFAELGFATAPFARIDARADLDAALERLGAPAILKTRRLGYDGKGQARIAKLEDAGAAYDAIARAPAILEGVCNFDREISIIAARGADGNFKAYDPVENEHRGGVLHRSRAPAKNVDASEPVALAKAVADKLDYVGVFAIEFFLMPDGAWRANEMAPRVHNSGHWTMDACAVDQFEQHIRAIAGWPLGSTERHSDAEMINLIGDDVHDWRTLAADPGARLHLYGKRDPRPGRKMGHVTRLLR